MTTLPDSLLEGHVRHYANFAEPDRTRMLAAVIKNYARSVDPSDPGRYAQWQAAVDDLANPLNEDLVLSHARRLAQRTRPPPKFGTGSLLSEIGAAVQQTAMTAEEQLGLALDMHEHGLGPVLTYAFNLWIARAADPKTVGRRLTELTVMGLYRLAEAQKPPPDTTLIGSGSAADVIRTSGRVHKYPRNYAAREVLLPLEFANYQVLTQTCLHDRIATNAAFDASTRILYHDYVPGDDGESMLRSGFWPNRQQQKDLRSLHGALRCELPERRLVLDLHPGNFVWDAARARWVLIDIGPIPVVGSEEYGVDSFTSYYTHTWLNRLDREHAEPIRSIDYSVGSRPM
ncbi:hypothetical protein [Nocardia fluminea]|uniref:Uncharacterized protein n=1 Tax=Nocardia fluminea TaxID=134984 RepID=A0A2N3VFR6_9NOCA|nr:hypothetical protein [Nocardia fluminea]PKV80478.1 hypothetical protein ATK86_4906 [Nocardia fluminea]